MIPQSLVAILGPTAAGKSSLAEFLALKTQGEIINSDASAFYQELSVGVTKPSTETRERIPHHLLDVTSLELGFDLMDYLSAANECLQDLARRERLPIVVGGSGLYARALLDGFRPPQIEVSTSLRDSVRALPIERALEELQQLDPAAYARIDRKNPRRVTRALELAQAVGGPVPPPKTVERDDLRILRLTLLPSREVLKKRIRRRTEEMWEPWLEEVDQLEKNGLSHWLDVRKPIGYSTILAFRRGECSRDEAVELIAGQTNKLAKKQRTWLKKESQHPFSHKFYLDSEDQWAEVPKLTWQLVQQFLS